ncbi:MAG: adenosylhomocysteinase [Anaerolineae bacterium]
MFAPRIRDPGPAHRLSDNELAWIRRVTPITEHYCQIIRQRDYRGKKLACWMHITENSVPMLLALAESGAEIVVGTCNTESTNDAAAAYLAEHGVTILAWRGMTRADYDEHKRIVRAFEADYLCDMGGELSLAYTDRLPPVKGALEATTSGLNHLHGQNLPFPVLDWNSIPLKDHIENRFHVGNEVWPVFTDVTSMSLYRRSILVVGYGPVGKGIAERARALGATVCVADVDSVRLVEAQHHGCIPVPITDGIMRCSIVVTATGRDGVIGESHLKSARSGTLFFNAGHSSREIDTDWLYQQPHQSLRQSIEEFYLGETSILLLAKGNLLNLAARTSGGPMDLFDLYTAVMLRGIAWMFEGGADRAQPSL